jgi:hypothetical protein
MSSFPATPDATYPSAFYTTSNSFIVEGLGVIGNIDVFGDAELHYIFHIPPSLPSGTAKLEVLVMGQPVVGASVKFNPYWKSVPVEDTVDLALGSLNAEGTQTVTFGPGDNNVFHRVKIALDADTVVADEFVVLRLVMESATWTLSYETIWLPAIIWE